MKTNAEPSIIAAAVKKVSAEKYAGNVVFRKEPEKLTKNTYRFTLKVRDKNKAGAMVDPVTNRKQPKVDQSVYIDVMQEIFKLDPRETIYGDHSVLGRLINENPSDVVVVQPEKNEGEVIAKEETPAAGKKASKKEKLAEQTGIQSNNVLTALQFLLENPNALAEIQKMQQGKKQKQTH
jgi:hypothetical protein